jgi:hypothetical protein
MFISYLKSNLAINYLQNKHNKFCYRMNLTILERNTNGLTGSILKLL